MNSTAAGFLCSGFDGFSRRSVWCGLGAFCATRAGYALATIRNIGVVFARPRTAAARNRKNKTDTDLNRKEAFLSGVAIGFRRMRFKRDRICGEIRSAGPNSRRFRRDISACVYGADFFILSKAERCFEASVRACATCGSGTFRAAPACFAADRTRTGDALSTRANFVKTEKSILKEF